MDTRVAIVAPDQSSNVAYGRLLTPLSAAVSPAYPSRATLARYEVDDTTGRLPVTLDVGAFGQAILIEGDCERYLTWLGHADAIDSGDNDGPHQFLDVIYQPSVDKTSITLDPPWIGADAGTLIVPKWQDTGEQITITNRFRETAAGSGVCVAGQDGFGEWPWLYLGCH